LAGDTQDGVLTPFNRISAYLKPCGWDDSCRRREKEERRPGETAANEEVRREEGELDTFPPVLESYPGSQISSSTAKLYLISHLPRIGMITHILWRKFRYCKQLHDYIKWYKIAL
jgi:hypothetical protein